MYNAPDGHTCLLPRAGRGAAVARLVWDQEVGSSNLPRPDHPPTLVTPKAGSSSLPVRVCVVGVVVGEAYLAGAVGIHHEYLAGAVQVGHEGDAVAIPGPCRLRVLGIVEGQPANVRPVGCSSCISRCCRPGRTRTPASCHRETTGNCQLRPLSLVRAFWPVPSSFIR